MQVGGEGLLGKLRVSFAPSNVCFVHFLNKSVLLWWKMFEFFFVLGHVTVLKVRKLFVVIVVKSGPP